MKHFSVLRAHRGLRQSIRIQNIPASAFELGIEPDARDRYVRPLHGCAALAPAALKWSPDRLPRVCPAPAARYHLSVSCTSTP